MESLLGFLGNLSGLDPVTSLFVAVAGLEAYAIYTILRNQSEREKDLSIKLQEANKLHLDTLQAIQEDRIDDLKDLVHKYDSSVQSIVEALKKIGK